MALWLCVLLNPVMFNCTCEDEKENVCSNIFELAIKKIPCSSISSKLVITIIIILAKDIPCDSNIDSHLSFLWHQHQLQGNQKIFLLPVIRTELRKSTEVKTISRPEHWNLCLLHQTKKKKSRRFSPYLANKIRWLTGYTIRN